MQSHSLNKNLLTENIKNLGLTEKYQKSIVFFPRFHYFLLYVYVFFHKFHYFLEYLEFWTWQLSCNSIVFQVLNEFIVDELTTSITLKGFKLSSKVFSETYTKISKISDFFIGYNQVYLVLSSSIDKQYIVLHVLRRFNRGCNPKITMNF